jgi:tetratricopeptide (TPR) repeat protein
MRRDARELVREARAVTREALARSHAARGWEALQERNAEGQAQGALPYTEAALAEFAAAHRRDPDDINITHHLAIAHHARAWDWELQGDARAAAEWELALGHWRTIVAAGEFWAGLKSKMLACDPNADTTVLDEARRDLLEHLLEVHVEFVRHYCGNEEPQRATAHVGIVQRARIPPAVKKRLVGKVYEAMTGTVPDAKAAGDFDNALTVLERFLALFPDYLPALRQYIEVARAWGATMSFQTDWDGIERLSERINPEKDGSEGAQDKSPVERLAAHPDLGSEPLARSELESLTFEFAALGYHRGGSYLADAQTKGLSVTDREEAAAAFDFALEWGTLGDQFSSTGSQMKQLLALAHQGRGWCLYAEAQDVLQTGYIYQSGLSTATRLYNEAIAEIEEAIRLAPDDEQFQEILKQLRDEMETLESQHASSFFSDWED